MSSPPITVIGAGFSGLVTAYHLITAGLHLRCPVKVIDVATRPGGLIQTERTPNGLIERAANGIVSSEGLLSMCERIGVRLETTLPQARNRYIFRDGKPRRWPLGLTESMRLAATVVSSVANLKPHAMETIQEWGDRVVGPKVTEYVLAPGLSGIYGGDPSRLSASLILGRRRGSHDRTKANKSVRPRTVAPTGGMQELIDGLVSFLEKSGVEILLGTQASVELDSPTIICTSAAEAAKLLAQIAPDASRQLAKIELLPLVSITCFLERRTEQPQGFGCLFPRKEGFRSLGVLFNDCIFPERSRMRSETWILGGALDRAVIDVSDEELIAQVTSEHQRLTSSRNVPVEVRVTRWRKALPHYTTDLELIINHRAILPGEILLVGNYLGKIGLTRIAEQAKDAATRMLGTLR